MIYNKTSYDCLMTLKRNIMTHFPGGTPYCITSSTSCFSKHIQTCQWGIYGGPYLPRQNLLYRGKTYFTAAKLTLPRQNLLYHGKTYFTTAKLTFPRQNVLFYGKTYFTTAKLTFPRQNLLFDGKTYFSAAKRKILFSRQNFIKRLGGDLSVTRIKMATAYSDNDDVCKR